MSRLKVRFSQSEDRRGVFSYAFRANVVESSGIPAKIFVYHQFPPDLEGNMRSEFDHVATPVDMQEIPEDAASETVPWYRTDRCVLWLRSAHDLDLVKQTMVDDISMLRKGYDILSSEDDFSRQTTVEFSPEGVVNAV